MKLLLLLLLLLLLILLLLFLTFSPRVVADGAGQGRVPAGFSSSSGSLFFLAHRSGSVSSGSVSGTYSNCRGTRPVERQPTTTATNNNNNDNSVDSNETKKKQQQQQKDDDRVSLFSIGSVSRDTRFLLGESASMGLAGSG